MNTEIWVAVIVTTGSITGLIITQFAQLHKSKQEGVKSDDVQALPAAQPDPNEGWRE